MRDGRDTSGAPVSPPLSPDSVAEPIGEAQPDWLALARNSYESSTSYLEIAQRRQWQHSLALSQSRHPPGSKYFSNAYKFRSRNFRPKTRGMIRRSNSAMVRAFFSTKDVVDFEGADQSNPISVAGAALMKALVEYRLDKTIPWFLLLLGAHHDVQVMGSVCAYVYWEYERSQEPKFMEVPGEEPGAEPKGFVEVPDLTPAKDAPRVELRPIENIRIDPASDWLDPINSSPYVVDVFPMFVGDVKERMKAVDDKTGQPKWKEAEVQMFVDNRVDFTGDAVRLARQGLNRVDPMVQRDRNVRDHDLIWVHRNIIRHKGQDWVYYTMGVTFLLSDPVRIGEVYSHCRPGRRPYVLGHMEIEPFKVYTPGMVELVEQTQIASNEVTNTRHDNVNLVLNKRYLVTRGSNTDVAALTRSVPGGSVLTDRIDAIKPLDFPEVTASAYQEQDRIDLDFDELAGNFSTGSVQSNRKLNETVGGMAMISNDAASVLELGIRVFAETFVKPVLELLVGLEKAYETDETVLKIAGQKAGIFGGGLAEIPPEVFDVDTSIRVNVGYGATNPQMRVEKLLYGVQAIEKIAPVFGQIGGDLKEVVKEVFGALGFQDGARFFPGLAGPPGAGTGAPPSPVPGATPGGPPLPMNTGGMGPGPNGGGGPAQPAISMQNSSNAAGYGAQMPELGQWG